MRRVLVSTAILALLAVVVGAVAVVMLQVALASKDEVIADHAAELLLVEKSIAVTERVARKTRAYLLTANERFLRDHNSAVSDWRAHLDLLDAQVDAEQSKEHLRRIRALSTGLTENASVLLEKRRAGMTAEEAAQLLERELQPDRDELDVTLAALERDKRQALESAKEEAARSAAWAMNFLVLTIGAALLLSAVLGFLLIRAYREVATAAAFQQRVIAIVGHDVRSPLSAILASASHMLSRADIAPGVANALQRIVRGARRIESLSRLLVDFTRSHAGSTGLAVIVQPEDLHHVTEQGLEELRTANPGRVFLHEKSGDARAEVDRERILQVLANLVDNALRHGNPDAPVKVVTVGAASAVELRVENQGPPIPSHLLPHIFEPFRYGSRPTDAAVRESLGIGLYIVAQIVKGHGGKVHAESTADATTFRVLLPRVRPDSDFAKGAV